METDEVEEQVIHDIEEEIERTVHEGKAWHNNEEEDGEEMEEMEETESITSHITNDIELMDIQHIETPKKHPELASNWIFRLTFDWVTPYVWKGKSKHLEMEDLPLMAERDKAKKVAGGFEKSWESIHQKYREEHEGQTTDDSQVSMIPLIRAILKQHGLQLVLCAFMKLLFDTGNLVSPLIVKAILQNISQRLDETTTNPSVWMGLLYIFLLFGCKFIAIMLTEHYFHQITRIKIHVKTALSSLIYKKMLTITNSTKNEFESGKIVNLLSVDAQKISDIFTYLNMTWSTFFQVGFCLVALFSLISYSTFACVIFIFLVLPFYALLFQLLQRSYKAIIEKRDKRVKTINEILQGIRILKFFTWEEPYENRVREQRKQEMRSFKKVYWVKSFLSALSNYTPVGMAVASITIFAFMSPTHTIKPEIVFPALTYLNLLRFPIVVFTSVLTSLIETSYSLKRLSTFLLAEEVEACIGTSKDSIDVELKNASFQHDSLTGESPLDKHKSATLKSIFKKVKEKVKRKRSYEAMEENEEEEEGKSTQEAFKLEDISLKINKGQLIAIVGAVGSGKSSLLQALFGEMNHLGGKAGIAKGKKTALVSQIPWIRNGTLRKNILFGTEYDKTHFDEIVYRCGLTHDLSILDAGELTEIGERGVNLSGGQRQRVNIARAVYSDADVYLFDDPLSAVDAHVGAHIFHECIEKYLKNKTRILVTHQLQYLSNCDYIIVMDNGHVGEHGTYKALMEKEKSLLKDLLQSYFEIQQEKEQHEQDTTPLSQNSHVSDEFLAIENNNVRGGETRTDDELKKRAGAALIESEERQKGNVSASTVWFYLKMMGGVVTHSIILFTLLASQGLVVLNDWWITKWVEQAWPIHKSVYATMSVYVGLSLLALFIMIFRSISFYNAGMNASTKLHQGAIRSVIYSTPSWMDSTPTGRVLSRFSKDTENADGTLIVNWNGMNICLSKVFFSFLIIIVATKGVFIAIFILVLPMYVVLQQLYRFSMRELKRLSSNSRSPIFAFYNESLLGLLTIRAYHRTNLMVEELMAKIDYNNRADYMLRALQRWLTLRLYLMGLFLLMSTTIIVFASSFISWVPISSSLAGLAIVYAINTSAALNWAVRSGTETEAAFNCVERLTYYMKNIPQEKSTMIPETDQKSLERFGEKGQIELNHVSATYRDDLPNVLHDVDCTIESGEKIGVVGRSGSGKTTLSVQMMFRFLHANEGQILIDGIDIASVPLPILRQTISIIPQEPILFSGTIRSNIDPFSSAVSDAVLWEALEKSHLKPFLNERYPETGLDTPVSESGDNFSVGQRQLFCLARALLNKRKILILDEATAAVDVESDALIQATIRKEFKECTVITIAHRLNTVFDADRIMVMQDGKLVEFDSPKHLMRRPSLFASMLSKQERDEWRSSKH